MNVFSAGSYPRRWSEMALDFKLMFALHGAVMVLFVLGSSLTVAAEAAIQIGLAAIVTLVAVRKRRSSGWRWAGAGWKQWAAAVFCLMLIIVFLGAALPSFSPLEPQSFPWYLAGAQIGAFQILASLRLARLSEQDFRKDCAPPDSAPVVEPPVRNPLDWVRYVFGTVFLAVWLLGVASFFVDGLFMRSGAAAPTADLTQAITEHGRTVFVSASNRLLHDALMTAWFAGCPVVIIAGLLIHAFVIPLWPNMPSFRAEKPK